MTVLAVLIVLVGLVVALEARQLRSGDEDRAAQPNLRDEIAAPGGYFTGPLSPPHWRHLSSGEGSPLRYEDGRVPFETTMGCADEFWDSSISWQGAGYLQNYTGFPELDEAYEANATLPIGAVFTSWQRGERQLWVDPSERIKPGPTGDAYGAIYIVMPDHVERWPLMQFGCF